MRVAAAVLACVLACAGWAAAARGAEATADEVRALATAAPRDPAAAARDEARDVLAQRRFRPTNVPAPLRDLRERIGEGLVSLGRPFVRALQWLAGRVPGGPPVLWALLATLVLAAAALLAGRAGTPHDTGRMVSGGAPGEEHMSAARLRQEAERAERAGALEDALRLRFRAGLAELDSRELIALRPALTNRELLEAVPSPTLAELVDGFEAVAYGGRPAGQEDLLSARDGWRRVPDEASRT